MKLAAYVIAGFVVLGLAFIMVTQPLGRNPLFMALFVFIFATPPLGAFWMMYQAIRYEKAPLLLILLAFLPYTFVWYYFEHVRGKDRAPAVAR
jgi:hypothetical protein